MLKVEDSVAAYDGWLRAQLNGHLVEKDLKKKHKLMAGKDPFVFLRATFWRWAETIPAECPEVAGTPPVLAVGDIHLSNFGTWRDADGRLVWGVNDVDEAAIMPYGLDLLRLMTSALLARHDDDHPSAGHIARAILDGYRDGLERPTPIVLESEHHRLREWAIAETDERQEFWEKMEKVRKHAAEAPEPFRARLLAALPDGHADLVMAPRSAGVGSLGRPRWVALASWRGAPVVREAKALVPSAWHRARGEDEAAAIRCANLLDGPYRAPDPWLRIEGGMVVRRLSPNNRKIEIAQGAERGTGLRPARLTSWLLRLMGRELANVHAGDAGHAGAVRADLKDRDAEWLRRAARHAAEVTRDDHAAWRKHHS